MPLTGALQSIYFIWYCIQYISISGTVYSISLYLVRYRLYRINMFGTFYSMSYLYLFLVLYLVISSCLFVCPIINKEPTGMFEIIN